MSFRTVSTSVVSLAMIAAAAARAQNGDRAGEAQPELPAEWMAVESPVRTPAEQLATFAIADGYEIELVAAEPLVEAPVAFEFAPDGRLWVLEMRGYMPDAEGTGERAPVGRVKVLEDSDADGRMDRAQVFLDGLVLPRAIALWRDGLLVVEPPHLLFCRDVDGDGRADESQVLAGGFAGTENPEHAGNGLLFSLDNAFTCSQHPFRFVVDGASLAAERVSPHGQWGIAEDAAGRLYYSPNSDPLLVDLLPKQYAARNPGQRNFEGVPARAATDTRVHPSHLTPGVNRGYQRGVLRDGRLANFTGACSPHVHEGEAMGTDMQGTALVCEVAGNLVHRYRLGLDATNGDARVVATPADGERSFLTSTDERFRPVHCAAGPDGAIYLADMYRGVIQHRIFMTTFLRRQIDARGLATPIDAGRIWRIRPKGAALAPAPDLSKLDAAGLVATLASPEKPRREIARRLLVERKPAEAAALLRAALVADDGSPSLATATFATSTGSASAGTTLPETTTPETTHPETTPSTNPDATRAPLATPSFATLERLWALAGIGALDEVTLRAVAAHPDPEVRVHALRAAERAADSVVLASLLARAAEDPERAVRVQAVLSSGRLDAPLRVAFVEGGLRRDLDAREMRSAALSALRGIEAELLEAVATGGLLDAPSVGARAFASEFADVLLDDGDGTPDPRVLATLLSTAARVAPARPWLAKALVERVAARQRLNSKEPVQLVAAAEPAGWFAMLDRLPTELALATPVDRNLFWPGREDVSFIPPKVARGAEVGFEEFGKRLYSNCMSCHQANGRGLPPVYPPLRGSEIVHGDPGVLVRIVMHGLEGPLELDGQRYSQVMPAAPLRTDEEIAAVLSYVRRAWGNAAPPVDAAFVAGIREETKGRTRPFTTKELGIAPRE